MKRFLKRAFAAAMTAAVIFTLIPTAAHAAEVSQTEAQAQLIDVDELKEESSLPSRYSSVDLGFVTSIKKQSANNCWAYGTLAALESSMLKKSFTVPEFSVSHMDNWGTPDAKGLGWQRDAGSGALNWLPMGYMISRQGPFEDFTDGQGNAGQRFAGINVNAVEYVGKDDPVRIKELIYEYGAVEANYNNSYQTYFNSDKTAFYCYDETAPMEGHGVSVVGWDDNYSKKNFTECGATPSQDGAWLVKNSWGNYNSLGGYFWLSYEDLFAFSDSLSKCFAITDFSQADGYEKLYQHETSGATCDFTSFKNRKEVTYINRYDFSDGFDSLNRVIFETLADGAAYSIYYIPAGESGIERDREKWTLLKSGVVDNSGYICVYTDGFKLPLGYGAIGVSINTEGTSLNNSIGASEWLRKTGTTQYYFLNESRLKESYVLCGDEFYDLKTYYTDVLNDSMGGTFVIKAEAENTSRQEVTATLIGDADLNGEVNIKDASRIQLVLAQLLDTSVIRELNSDFDRNGEVTIQDAANLQLFLAHLL